jgi:acetylornithine deacetylase/succinyl-diaminopimelate desuccinylase-like protein
MKDLRIDGLGSLLGRVGDGAKKLVFDAHIDTVGVGDPGQWKTPPHSGLVKDGLVYGRGASDQLGGAASMITAAKILNELSYKGDYQVWFAFTTIEEDCDGLCWKHLIEEEKFVPDFVVSTEPTSCRLYRGHRGRMEIQIEIRGVSSHGSAPERGESAAYKAARAALAIESSTPSSSPTTTASWARAPSWSARSRSRAPSQCAVPDQAMLYCDRRLTWGEDDKLAIGQVEKALKDAGVDKLNSSCPSTPSPRTPARSTSRSCTSRPGRSPRTTSSSAPAWRATRACTARTRRWTSGPSRRTAWPSAAATRSRSSASARATRPRPTRPTRSTASTDLEKCAAFYASLPYAMEKQR